MLYVGAREALFALSLSDISKTKLQKNVSDAKWSIRVSVFNEEVDWQLIYFHYYHGYKWHFDT